MSVYNADAFLEECLQSIANQTYENWELVIINDGSTDSSDDIIKRYMLKFNSRINYLKLNKNQGLPNCLNKGVELSKGEFIVRIDADDIMIDTRLEIQVKFMLENPEVGLLGTAAIIIDEKGNNISALSFPETNDEIKKVLLTVNPFLHPTVIIRRNLLSNDINYRDKYPKAEDYDLWLRLSRYTQFQNLPIPLIKYRVHNGQISQKNIKLTINDALRLKIDLLKENKELFFNFNFLIKLLFYYFLPKSLLSFWLMYKKNK
ncbi:hypothetical protein GCM10028809_34180 [Spirosoma gilvum]